MPALFYATAAIAQRMDEKYKHGIEQPIDIQVVIIMFPRVNLGQELLKMDRTALCH